MKAPAAGLIIESLCGDVVTLHETDVIEHAALQAFEAMQTPSGSADCRISDTIISVKITSPN